MLLIRHSSKSFLVTAVATTTIILLSPTIIQANQSLQPPTPFLHNNNNIMPNNNNNNNSKNDINNDSTVLAELKETIRNQAKELELLRANQQFPSLHPAAAAAATTASSKTAVMTHGHATSEPSDEDVAKYLQQPFYQTSLTRVGWLGIFLCSLSATAVIMNTFEHTLEKHIELSYFVPLLAGHGGNTGGQTIGTILSALSSGAIQPKDAARVVAKEAMAGVMSGFLLGTMVSPIAYQLLGVSFPVATVLFFTMPLVSTIASTLGSAIPFLCIFMGLDPSVIAAPAMTSFVDVCGLMAYFLIANQIFKVFGLEL